MANTNYNRPGMTLIELITSVALIGIISAIFIANYRTGIKRTDLVMTTQTAVADIRLAQANALGLIKYEDEVPAGGWGVFFSTAASSSYVIFADKNNNGRFDSGENTEASGGRTVSLPGNIRIDQVSLGGQANIIFLPPDPTTNISIDGGATTTAVTILMKELNDGTIKTIRVNFLGLAEVID
jgi:prepilin-type N-terminal cleavage/methylation domain-containing protein